MSPSSNKQYTGKLLVPKITELRDLGRGRTLARLANAHVSTANAMRRTLLARLPVIGIPFEPYAASKVVVTANTTDDTDQSIWYRLGNTPVHSLDPALVTDYAVTLDVVHKEGADIRVVTTADLRLERINSSSEEEEATSSSAVGATLTDLAASTSKAAPTVSAKRTAAVAFDYYGGAGAGVAAAASGARRRAPLVVGEIFPPNEASNDHIALAELRPPVAVGAPAGALQLRATFEWMHGSGAFAPNVVGFQNTHDKDAADAAWAKKEVELRAIYAREAAGIAEENAAGAALPEMRHSLEKTLSDAEFDFRLTGAKMFFLENQYDFSYEVINRAYPFRRAWRQAADMLVEELREILASVTDDTLKYYAAGTAASQGYASVTHFSVVGGFGFDVIVPNLDHTLGPAMSHALIELCFARTRAETEDSDRLVFCAFHQFTPDDDFGVLRIALARDDSALIPRHIKTACRALIELFAQVSDLVRE